MISFLAALILVGGSPLAGRDIGGKLDVPAYGMVRVHIQDMDPKAAVVWFVQPEPVDYEDLGDRLLFTGAPGKYQVTGIILRLTADGRTEKRVVKKTAVIRAPGDVLPDDPKPDPNPPSPPKPGGFYFLVVTPPGPASPEFNRVMSLPEWKTLAEKHTVRVATQAEAAAWGYTPPAGVTVPFVVTFRNPGGVKAIARPPVVMPSDGASVLKLLEGL